MRFLSPRGVLTALLVLSSSLPTLAQDATGKITGNVTDPSGAAIAGAKISVTNLGTSIAKETTTDRTGYYQVLQLPIGSKYQVTAEAGGFDRAVNRPDTVLDINQTLRVDIALQIGATTNTVTVEAQGTSVETENAVVGGVVSGQAIFELPLNGRNTLDLLATQPGVTVQNPDNGAAGTYSIGGQRTDSVTYLLDGGNNNNLLSNAVVANPNPDSVAEFRVLESNYGAEYGRNAGGIVSVVTKSGSNNFHGTAYDYLRNDDLDANLYFNNEQGLARPVLKRNQFGGTLGGPLTVPKLYNGKDKLFFFFSYEGQRQSSLDQAGKVNTFTPEEAAGNFSQAGSDGGPDSAVVSFLQKNPYYQANPNLAAQGIIDPTKIDPIAQKYLTLGLIPTSASGFLFPQASALNNYDQFLGKFDYYVTNRDSVSGTFTSTTSATTRPFGNANVNGYTASYGVASYFGNVTYTHTFAPTLLNEFRVTAQRHNSANGTPLGDFASNTASTLGIGVTPDQPTGPTDIYFLGSGLSIGYSPNGPTSLIDNTYAFYDNLSWTHGRHTMKYGFYFSPYQNNTVYDFYVNGAYYLYGPSTYTGSGNDFADFLLGAPDEYLQFGSAPSNIRSNQYAAFAQDEWHMRKNLTLTFGVRYEYSTPKYDTQGRSFSIVPGAQSQRFVNAPTGLLFPGDPGAPKGSNFPDKNDWAPRLGFAWDVFGNARTSIRGGVGMFYDVLKGEDNLQFNGQAPFFGYSDLYFNPPNSGSASVNPFTSPYPAAGATNTFPSKPPASDLDFDAAGFLPFGGGGVYFVDPNLRTPYVFQYNLSLQQQLASNLVAEFSYVGYDAHKLTSLVDNNPFILGTNTRLQNTAAGADFSYLNTFENVGKANYNAFQASLTKRFGGGLSYLSNSFLQVSYTWSHEIDNTSGFRERNSSVPYYDHDYFRASGDADLRHSLAVSGGWELPFEHLWARGPKLLTKGWSLYPIASWHSGFPLDVFAGLSTSRRDPGPSGAGDAGNVRADLVTANPTTLNPQSYQTINGSSGNYYLNPADYSNQRLLDLDDTAYDNAANLNGQYSYGTLGRNALRGPGFVNVDLSIAKHFYFAEKFDTEFRADMFNVFNHTNFANPDTTITDSTFGQISSTRAQRIIQLAIHVKF